MNWLLLLALAVGAALPVQACVNARLGKGLANPFLAALVSFAVGTLFLLLYCVATRVGRTSATTLSSIPAWAWIGGIIGAIYITTVILLTPRLGVGTTMSLIIAGQILASVALDHFGILGLETHPISLGRALGVVLLIGGVVLVRRF